MGRQIRDLNGNITTGFPSDRQFEETGSIAKSDFAVVADSDSSKKIALDPSLQATATTVTLKSPVVSGNITVTLPNSTSTILTTAGEAAGFSIIQPITGTSPTASIVSDTLTFASANGTLAVAGNSSTKTIDLAVAGIALVDEISGFIEAATAKTYTLDLACAFACTINSLNIKTVSGTCTVAIKINGVDVTSLSAVSVSSVLSTTSATGANTVAIGNAITLVVSSISAPVDTAFTLKITKT